MLKSLKTGSVVMKVKRQTILNFRPITAFELNSTTLPMA